MREMMREMRYAARRIRRSAGFAAVVATTLALGVGATTAIYSVVDGVLLRPLPYEEPDRLVLLWGDETGQRTGSSWASYPDYVDFEEQASSFAQLAAWSTGGATLTGDAGEPIRVSLLRVTHDLFPTLGVAPLRGRGFLEEEDRAGAPPVALLDHGLWVARWGADPGIVGRSIRLDGTEVEVVGVMPPGFDLGGADVYTPLVPVHAEDSRGSHRIVPIARLTDDATLDGANAEVAAIAARLERRYPEWNTNRGAYLEPLHEAVVGDVRATLWAVFGMVGLVLLIACANVANLLLSRATERARDVAIRSALGAGRRHILRQLGAEGLLLTAIGGATGIGVAYGGLRLLRALAPPGIPRLEHVALDGRVLAFAAVLTGLTGLAFTLIPALQSLRVDLRGRLEGAGRSGSVARRRLPQGVVVLEVALAVVVVVAAGLLLTSFVELRRVDPGFTADDVLVVPIALPEGEYWDTGDAEEDGSRAIAFFEEAERRVGRLPGVTSVASAYMHPLSGGWESSFWIPGVLEAPRGERPEARIRPVTPGYFRTVGMRLVDGRDFTDRDGRGAPGVVIVNESFARTFFPSGDAVGHRIARGAWWAGQPEEYEIVGVVGDVRMDGLAETVPTALYFPHAQFPFAEMNLVVGTSVDPRTLVGTIRERIWSIDPQLPIENVRTLAEVRSGSIATERFRTILVGLFAAVSLLLAAIGIYGVLSYAVAARTREMGLRMSLGARRADVVRLVVRQGLGLTGVGIALGLVVAASVAGLLSGLLFRVRPVDLATYAAVAALLGLVSLIACLAPAARATRVDPLVALRAE